MNQLYIMAEILMEAGDLIPLHEGFFEDMGGHLIHEDDVPSYFEEHLKHLDAEEKLSVLGRLAEND